VSPGAVSRIGLLGLGSNVGERRSQLQAALDALAGIGVQPLASSSTYDTDPVGEVLEQPSFLNACVRVRTQLGALELLDALKRVESELGRRPGGPRHGPRAIDIDLLLLGELELEHERLTLPHEQLLSRRFVLIPALSVGAWPTRWRRCPCRRACAGPNRRYSCLRRRPAERAIRKRPSGGRPSWPCAAASRR